MSRGAVGKTEVIIDRISLTAGDERFIEWMEGWLRARYVVDVYLRHNMTEVVFIVEKDMFRLFEEMYRVVEYMRWKLRAKTPIAVCDSDECVDMSDNDYDVLVSNYKIKKLKKARNVVKQLVKDDDVYGVSVISWFGYAILNIGCYGTLLYTDEVIALSGLLLEKLYYATNLKILKDAYDYVYSVVKPIDVDLSVLDLEVERDEAGIGIRLDGCDRGFTYEEVLRLVYKLLTVAVDDLTDTKMIMRRDYGVE